MLRLSAAPVTLTTEKTGPAAGEPGAPTKCTPEQIYAIMALACEMPERATLPLSHWSQSEPARESIRRGVVDSISHGSVGCVLKREVSLTDASTVQAWAERDARRSSVPFGFMYGRKAL